MDEGLLSFFKIKEFLKRAVERNTKDQRQPGSRVKLPRLDRTDRVAGNTHKFRELRLGKLFGVSCLPKAILKTSRSSMIAAKLGHKIEAKETNRQKYAHPGDRQLVSTAVNRYLA